VAYVYFPSIPSVRPYTITLIQMDTHIRFNMVTGLEVKEWVWQW